jgi:hypothetical protein
MVRASASFETDGISRTWTCESLSALRVARSIAFVVGSDPSPAATRTISVSGSAMQLTLPLGARTC